MMTGGQLLTHTALASDLLLGDMKMYGGSGGIDLHIKLE